MATTTPPMTTQATTTRPRIYSTKDSGVPVAAVDIGPRSRWATPFTPGKYEARRDELVRDYAGWVQHGPQRDARWIREHAHLLIGKDLTCPCGRLEHCHGLALLDLAERASKRLDLATFRGWRRIVLPRDTLGIQLSGSRRNPRIIDAEREWMIGRTLTELAGWLRVRGGRIDRLDSPLGARA